MTIIEQRDLVLEPMKKLGLKPHDLLTPVYKYRSIEWAKETLTTSKLIFSNAERLRTLGDDYELHQSIVDWDFTDVEIIKHIKHLGIDETVDSFRKNKVPQIREYFSTMIGILSLGETATNSHLWERYGDKHKGVCLGIKLPPEGVSNLLPFHINYPPQPDTVKIIDEVTGALNGAAIYYWLCTKREQYKPENEVRVIREDETGSVIFKDGMLPISFEKDMLVEIVLGKDTTETQYKLFSQLASDNGYKVEINKVVVDNNELKTVDAKTLYS